MAVNTGGLSRNLLGYFDFQEDNENESIDFRHKIQA
jgi:hypothetical protein